MATNKSYLKRVPQNAYDRVARLGNKMDIATTEAFRIQEKILFGDFIVKKKTSNGKKRTFELF